MPILCVKKLFTRVRAGMLSGYALRFPDVEYMLNMDVE